MLTTTDHSGVVEISMNRPPVNAMNRDFLLALQSQHAELVENGANAIVISGREGLFSAGLDVPELLEQDRDDIEAFWTTFFELMRSIASSSIPVAAAITGHSPAGGMVAGVVYRLPGCNERRLYDGAQ